MGTHISVKAHCLQTFDVSFVYVYLLTTSSISSSLSFSFSSSLQCLLAFFYKKDIVLITLSDPKICFSIENKNIYLSCLKKYTTSAYHCTTFYAV